MAERRSALHHMNRADYWLAEFSKLCVDRARGDPTPYKPPLLLLLCDLLECGSLLPLYPRELARGHLGSGRSSQPASWLIEKRRQAAALQNNGQSLASSKTNGHHHPSQLLACEAFEITG
jgi:hypothetical protein